MHSKLLLQTIRFDHIYYDNTILLTIQEEKKVFFGEDMSRIFLDWVWGNSYCHTWIQHLARNTTILATSVPTTILQTVKFWPRILVLPQFSFLPLGATKRTLLQSPLHTYCFCLCIPSSSAELWFYLAVSFNVRMTTSTKAKSSVTSL